MIAQLTGFRQAIERRLYGMGFALPVARHILCSQLVITGLALVTGLVLCWYSTWPIAFGAGAALTTFSLWHISRSAQAFVRLPFSPLLGLRLFIGFTARLTIIGIALFALIVWLKVPVAPVLLGLTSTVASILLWGISRISRKTAKEA